MMKKASDLIIHRAVDIWCKKLFNPVFDNGDDSEHGGMSHILATMNIQNAKAGINDMAERVEVFRTTLTESLIKERDTQEYFRGWLDVDYGPCKELADAAEVAGIPDSQFSCKSSVNINEDYVDVSFGYGAEHVNHYPLPNGKWLLTTLRGSDIDKIIAHVAEEKPLDFVIEG